MSPTTVSGVIVMTFADMMSLACTCFSCHEVETHDNGACNGPVRKRQLLEVECTNIALNFGRRVVLDITLARTFLEIVACGSFHRASERLHVTQTAVSARV